MADGFETFGPELEFVLAVKPSHVWTMVDCDGKWRLTSGYHLVNRLFYMITEIPYAGGTPLDVPYY